MIWAKSGKGNHRLRLQTSAQIVQGLNLNATVHTCPSKHSFLQVDHYVSTVDLLAGLEHAANKLASGNGHLFKKDWGLVMEIQDDGVEGKIVRTKKD
eukprot:7602499-Ditylum_brightwellii.AAC.1